MPNDNYLFHCSHCGYYVTDIVDGNSRYDELVERWAKGDELLIDIGAIDIGANAIKKTDDNFSYYRLYNDWCYCPHCGRKKEG